MTPLRVAVSFLAGTLLFGAQLLAQSAVQPPAVMALHQTVTTGMVGVTNGQIARLNVLNVSSVPVVAAAGSTAPVANCTVALQFLDAKSNLLKTTVVTGLAPGMATYLDLRREEIAGATAGRTEIRGVVSIILTPSLVESAAPTGYCSLLPTLEVFDSATGATLLLTSDTRAVGGGFAGLLGRPGMVPRP